jgi:hypothetical protein
MDMDSAAYRSSANVHGAAAVLADHGMAVARVVRAGRPAAPADAQ